MSKATQKLLKVMESNEAVTHVLMYLAYQRERIRPAVIARQVKDKLRLADGLRYTDGEIIVAFKALADAGFGELVGDSWGFGNNKAVQDFIDIIRSTDQGKAYQKSRGLPVLRAEEAPKKMRTEAEELLEGLTPSQREKVAAFIKMIK